jgi:PST family polysaccharide transporter
MTNKSSKGLGSVAAKGMLWMSVSVILSKIAAFLSQWGVAYFLEPEDFGLYALAIAITPFTSGFLDSGIGKLIVQRKREFNELAVPSLHLSIILSLFGCTILLILGYLFVGFYDEPELLTLIAILTIGNPFYSASAVYKAKINADLKFRQISLVDILHAISYSSLLFGLAYFGAGPYSFVVALAATRIILFIMYYYLCGSLRGKGHTSIDKIKEIIKDLKWIIVGAFLLSLAVRGDYFVLGFSLDPAALGYYYFGFLITASFGLLLSQGVQGVLMPVFSSMQDNLTQMRKGLMRSSSTIILFCGALCIVLVVGLPRLIDILWSGKWNEAIYISVLMALSLPIRIVAALGRSVLEAKGSWQARTIFLAFDAVTLLIAAFLGAYLNGLQGAAISVALHRVTFGIAIFIRGLYELETGVIAAINYIYIKSSPFLFVAFALLYFEFVDLSPQAGFTWNEFFYLTQVLVVSLLIFILLSFIFNKEGVMETIKLTEKIKTKLTNKRQK